MFLFSKPIQILIATANINHICWKANLASYIELKIRFFFPALSLLAKKKWIIYRTYFEFKCLWVQLVLDRTTERI